MKTERIIICITLLLSAAALRADISDDLRDGLKGYWPLDETSGTNLPDFTTTRNHGWFDVGSPTWVQGKFSNGLEVLEGTFDRAVIPHHASYNENNAYSISLWFTPISIYRNYNVFNKGAGKVALGTFCWLWPCPLAVFRLSLAESPEHRGAT